MDQSRVDLPAGDGEIAHREPVDFECGERLFFRDVDLIVGGGVEHDRRIVLSERVLDLRRGR